MATKAHQSVAADRIARGKGERSGRRRVAAIGDSSDDVLDGYAEAA